MNDDQENSVSDIPESGQPAEMAPEMPSSERRPIPFAFVPGWLRGLILGFIEGWF